MLKNNRAFTLIETLIYIAILAIVVSGFVTYSISISNSRNKNYVVTEVQANSRNALNIITQKILSAESVNIGSSTFDSDPGVLSLTMPDLTKNPTIISLKSDDGRLQIKEGAGAAVSITSSEVKVTNLVFTNLTGIGDKENIRIETTVEYNNLGDDVEFNYSQSLRTAINLRQ